MSFAAVVIDFIPLLLFLYIYIYIYIYIYEGHRLGLIGQN